jgi:nicotinate phosphoribosyltransferase
LNLSSFKQEPLLEKVMEDGKRTTPSRSVSEIADYSKSRLAQLPDEYKRFQNPHIYKIGLSTALKQERDTLVQKHKF